MKVYDVKFTVAIPDNVTDVNGLNKEEQEWNYAISIFVRSVGQSLIVHAKIVLKAIVDSQHGFGCPMVNVQSVLGVDIHSFREAIEKAIANKEGV